MAAKLSKRLADIVNALPLHEGMRVLEIGCGPGAAAREVAKQTGYVLAIDRSAKAVAQAATSCADEIAAGTMHVRQAAVETFELDKGEKRFDIAFAIRVGVLDGRHPEKTEAALRNIARALKKNGKLYIDGGKPLREVALESYR